MVPLMKEATKKKNKQVYFCINYKHLINFEQFHYLTNTFVI